MKRTPLKRTKGLSRATPLKADPEKTRAWLRRSRDTLIERARGPEDAPQAPKREDAAPQRKPKRRRKARIPVGVRMEAVNRSRGCCIVCLHRAGIADPHKVSDSALRQLVRRGAIRAAAQLHHVLPEQKWPHLAKVADNLVGVCPWCHDEHERALPRIPRAILPACVIELARAEGLDWYIEATYP